MKIHQNKKTMFLKFATLTIFLSLVSVEAVAQKQRSKPEVLLAGDSWGSFLCSAEGYPETIKKLRIRNLAQTADCDLTTDSGIEAREWLGSNAHKEVLKKINDRHSAVKFIHLSLGGNDLISFWHKNLSTDQEIEIFERNFLTIHQIAQTYLNAKPHIKVILSGYDFPRFTHNHKISKYRKILEKMGSPSPGELNSALVRYHDYIERRFRSNAAYQSRMFVIHHLGLGHYYLGIPDAGVPAGRTLHPDQISTLQSPNAVGGDVNYMSAKKWMTHWIGGLYDAFHLSDEGHQFLAEHVYRNIIQHQ